MIIPVLKCYLNTTQKGIEHGLLLIINSLVYNKRKQCGKDSTKKLLFARLCLIFLKKNKNLKFKSSVILIIF